MLFLFLSSEDYINLSFISRYYLKKENRKEEESFSFLFSSLEIINLDWIYLESVMKMFNLDGI